MADNSEQNQEAETETIEEVPVATDEAAPDARKPKKVSVKDQVKGRGVKLEDFVWHGGVDSISLTKEGKSDEVIFSTALAPGKPVKVPTDHPVIKQMIALKLLRQPKTKTAAAAK